MGRVAEIYCDYQNTIEGPPVAPGALYSQACSNDKSTIDYWRPTWLKNVAANKETFVSFALHGLGHLHNLFTGKACIVVGSGPSLEYNAKLLVKNEHVPVVSCLHNFHYLEDLGVNVDLYVSLDAGAVTIEEVSEGGSKTPEEYWAMTKGKRLAAFIGSDPELLKKWQGDVYLFACPFPDERLAEDVAKIEPFHTYVSNGGNVLGACLYIAKCYLGAGTVAFLGADFSFGYKRKFHAWNSKYDANMGHTVPMTDVFGNRVLSWQSYANFKAWFDHIACVVPGLYVNCTEGGTFGAYPEGNIKQVIQMSLEDFLAAYHMTVHTLPQSTNPQINDKTICF